MVITQGEKASHIYMAGEILGAGESMEEGKRLGQTISLIYIQHIDLQISLDTKDPLTSL